MSIFAFACAYASGTFIPLTRERGDIHEQMPILVRTQMLASMQLIHSKMHRISSALLRGVNPRLIQIIPSGFCTIDDDDEADDDRKRGHREDL